MGIFRKRDKTDSADAAEGYRAALLVQVHTDALVADAQKCANLEAISRCNDLMSEGVDVLRMIRSAQLTDDGRAMREAVAMAQDFANLVIAVRPITGPAEGSTS